MIVFSKVVSKLGVGEAAKFVFKLSVDMSDGEALLVQGFNGFQMSVKSDTSKAPLGFLRGGF